MRDGDVKTLHVLACLWQFVSVSFGVLASHLRGRCLLQVIPCGDLVLHIIRTPGHTPGVRLTSGITATR